MAEPQSTNDVPAPVSHSRRRSTQNRRISTPIMILAFLLVGGLGYEIGRAHV